MKNALCFCVLLSAATLFATEPAKPTTDWKAEWMTADRLPDPAPANLWLVFRKNFELTKVPDNAICRIACDSKYQLYVNSKRVVFNGQLHREPTLKGTYHDVVDLTGSLKPGRNVVAVLVWFFGKDGFSHKNSGVPGLLFEVWADGAELLSDATWKAMPYCRFDATDPTWKNHPFSAYEPITANPQPSDRLAESNIRYDARYEFKGDWTSLDFDDSDWPVAKALGKPPVVPWKALYERPVPLGRELAVTDYANKSEIPSVSDGKPVVCKLPRNMEITPLLNVDAPEGYTVDIRTDQYESNGQYGVRSEYVTKSGVQEYESAGRMNGNAVIYTMPAGVKILSLQYREATRDGPR